MQTLFLFPIARRALALLLLLALLLALPAQAQDAEAAMTDSVFVSIRLYDGIAPADQTEITRFSAEEFLPIIRADDGFIAYFVLPMEDRLAAINLFTSEELAAASNEKARDFVAENMAPLLPNPPQIVSGLVEVLYMAALADMETMAEEADSDETDAMDEMDETMMADGYGALYAALRVYDNYDIAHLAETTERVMTIFLPQQQEAAGFFGYMTMSDGDDIIAALSIYDSEENALASNEMAAEFVAEHLAQWLPEEPQRLHGTLAVAALAELHEGANLIQAMMEEAAEE